MKNRKRSLSKSEVFSIIDEVEATFAAGLNNVAGTKLAKSEEHSEDEEEKKKKKEDEKDESEMEKCGEMSKSEEAKEEECHDDHEMHKSENFFGEVKDLYSSMTKSERALHAQALNQVFDESAPQKMQKSEAQAPAKNSHVAELESRLEKSEADNAALMKSVNDLTDRLSSAFGIGEEEAAPAAKAATNLEYVAKSEGANGGTIPTETDWSNEKINKKLERISKSEGTSVDDREAINEYYLNGRNIETIQHLLK